MTSSSWVTNGVQYFRHAVTAKNTCGHPITYVKLRVIRNSDVACGAYMRHTHSPHHCWCVSPPSHEIAHPPRVLDDVEASPELRRFIAACLQRDPFRRHRVEYLLRLPFVGRRHVTECRRALRKIIEESMQEQQQWI